MINHRHYIFLSGGLTPDHSTISRFRKDKQVEQNTGLKLDVSLCDTGYCDEASLEFLASSGQEALIPIKEQPQERKRNDLFASRCFLRAQNKDALICPAGRELTFRRIVKCSSGRYRV